MPCSVLDSATMAAAATLRSDCERATRTSFPRTHASARYSSLPLALLLGVVCALLCVAHPAAADPTLLSSLSSSLTTTHNAPLVPPFDPAETSYAQNVPNGAREVTFRAVAAEPDNAQLWARWNAGDEFRVQSDVDTPPLPLDTQLIHELQLIVRSASGDNVYLISITRSSLVSQNANLLSFAWLAPNGSAVEAGEVVRSMEPAFSSQIFQYAVQLAPGVSQLAFVGTVEAQATLTWTANRTSTERPETVLESSGPAVLASGAASPALSLETAGQRLLLHLHVLAEDAATTSDYMFEIRQADDTAPPSGGLDLNAASNRYASAAAMATGVSVAVSTLVLAAIGL